MNRITVLGGGGFIGSHLARRIRSEGGECYCPGRDEPLTRRNLGHVIYCIGVTADFRSRPLETVDAHVCTLVQLLRECEFDSLLYLSSTRVYDAGSQAAYEDDPVQVDPANPDHLYNISKVAGEALTLACDARTRIVRLSNVYGLDFESPSFLPSLIRDAVRVGKIVLRSSLESVKDYVSIADTVDALVKIALTGRERVYNVASGTNVSTRELVNRLSELTGCEVEVVPGAKTVRYPPISIARIADEFTFSPGAVVADLSPMVSAFASHFSCVPNA